MEAIDFETNARSFLRSVCLPGVVPMPGVLDLLDALRDHGIPLGLATNSGREFATRALRAAGLLERYAAVVSAEDVERPKPAPDVYLAAAAALGAEPVDCVALEDSETGVTAARAAGMTVVGVPSFPGIDLADAHLVA